MDSFVDTCALRRGLDRLQGQGGSSSAGWGSDACQRTEDNTGADEAYLNYNGERVFGPRQINDGQTRTLGIVRPISGEARVDLFDEDSPDADDFLGSITIRRSEVNQGQKAQDFRGDGARYTLFYRVSEVEDE